MHLLCTFKVDVSMVGSSYSTYTKFFYVEAKLTMARLGRTSLYPGEDIDAYVRPFQEKALGYCDPVAEGVLVGYLSTRYEKEYVIHLENLSFTPFSHLMEVARRTNGSFRKIVKSNSTIRPNLKKKTLVEA